MEERFKEIDFKIFDTKKRTYVFVDTKTGNTLNIIRGENSRIIQKEMGWNLF